MLAHSIRITDRTAYEFYRAEAVTLELYRATSDWLYIVEAKEGPVYDDEIHVIHRKAVPGRFATLGAGMVGLTLAAANAEQAVKAWLEEDERRAKAEDLVMRRNDPGDPLYWAGDFAEAGSEG